MSEKCPNTLIIFLVLYTLKNVKNLYFYPITFLFPKIKKIYFWEMTCYNVIGRLIMKLIKRTDYLEKYMLNLEQSI